MNRHTRTYICQVPLLFALLALLGCSGGGAALMDIDTGVPPRDSGVTMDVPRDTAVVDTGVRMEVPPVEVTMPDVGAADGGCPPSVEMVPFSDRTMNEEFTDPPMCTGCPGAFRGTEELDAGRVPGSATALRIEGSSLGAQRCDWYVASTTCGVTYGTATTDPDGAGLFATTVPVFCGTNIIRIVCRNSAGRRVLVRRVEGPMCPDGGRDLRVTLTWDDQGTDMELHLLRATGRLNQPPDDCTWFTCMGDMGLDWGVPGDARDNPRKDIDNTGFFGPENIFLDRAPAGTYHILVEFWGGGMPSQNEVAINVRERTVARLVHPRLNVHEVWYVGTLSYPAGTFTPVDSITPCAMNWMATTRGCDLPLPR
ncbi:MAG: hypothetical protein HY909_04025 [Deltaproteobacteria bacterium]|nr:hypothetical protein [Deltaproteobacteria bacterium]